MSSVIANHERQTTMESVDEDRWNALLARDRAQDGRFVFAVITTGVYCRPSCGARRPLRRNVRFFDDPAAAERAGFRACRRCHPREVAAQTALAESTRRWLEAHPDERTTLARLAAQMGVSTSHLQRTFTRAYGVSPRAFQAALRLDSAKRNLRRGQDVTQALYAAGYGSSSRFYEQARTDLGMPPATYRRGGAGVAIAYAIVPHHTGWLLLAATAHGICAASLGEDPAELEAALRSEFPHAELKRDDAVSSTILDAGVAQVSGDTAAAAPLDVSGTPFQRQVWSALRSVPVGETRSYADIAAHIGQPAAARAVAGACAANPVALLIPCHRVVRADGEPGGYRWGVERKRALLAEEVRGSRVG